MEIDLSNILGSTWLLPVMGLLSWALVKFLDGKFVSTEDFNAYKEARGKEEKEYREFKELGERESYIQRIDKKEQKTRGAVQKLAGHAGVDLPELAD